MKKQISKSVKDKYVGVAVGLGLGDANCEREATWNDYFVLGLLIHTCIYFSDKYEKMGYVDADSCSLLWKHSGLDEQDAHVALDWLIANGYICQIHLDKSRLAYKVVQWALDKVNVRKTRRLIASLDELISQQEKESAKTGHDQAGAAEVLRSKRDGLKKEYDMLISRLKNVDCGISEEVD